MFNKLWFNQFFVFSCFFGKVTSIAVSVSSNEIYSTCPKYLWLQHIYQFVVINIFTLTGMSVAVVGVSRNRTIED